MTNAPVAPDVLDRCRINRLVPTAEIRLTLLLGPIEKLFADPPNTPEGRMARLQVLGLFYFPLKHRRARDAYLPCWNWVKERIFRVTGDAEADALVQEWLRKRVVDSPCGGLPGSGEFAKIRLPGGYTCFTAFGSRLNADPKYPMDFGDEIHTVEEFFYRDNPVLGRLPIVAKVETRSGNDWEPLRNAAVQFQLVPPATLPLYMSHKEILEQVTPPALLGERADSIQAAEGRRPPPKNPPFDAPSAQTNETGEATVIFSPSRMGGERYRLRVSVGTQETAPFVETGTLVVWRNIRLSRWVRKEVRPTVAPAVVQDASVAGIADQDEYLQEAGLADRNGRFMGMPPARFEELQRLYAEAYCELEFDGEKFEVESIPVAEYEEAMRRAIEDFEIGMKEFGKNYSTTDLFFGPFLSQAFVEESVALLPMRTPEGYDQLDSDGSRKQLITPDGTLSEREARTIGDLIDGYAVRGFLRHFSRNGSLPGLVVVQGAVPSSWQIYGLVDGFTGIVTQFRGCIMTGGRSLYESRAGGPAETFSLMTPAHELGHCLFREHAPGKEQIPGTHPPEYTPVPAGANAREHDATSKCLMGYMFFTKPSFCAKCLLALRGWDIRSLP